MSGTRAVEVIVDSDHGWSDGFRAEVGRFVGGTPCVELRDFSRSQSGETSTRIRGMSVETARRVAAALVEVADALESEDDHA